MVQLARFSSMLRAALDGGYAVPAFNVYSMETIMAVFKVAKSLKAPSILALGERYFQNMRPATARALVDSLLQASALDNGCCQIGLHLDHAMDPLSCHEAIEAGFTSVMIDTSHLPFEEQIQITCQVVEDAHLKGVEVEAELGGLAAGDASHEFSTGVETLTDPEQAHEFVERTGIDALAVSVGTVHGLYRGEPHIDLKRLEAIRSKVSTPLVLHGGSGTPEDLVRAAIARGIAKINVNTEVSLAAIQRLREELGARPDIHMADVSKVAIQAMEETIIEYVARFNASHRLVMGT